MNANSSTWPIKVSAFVKGVDNSIKVKQSPMSRSKDSKAPDSYLSGYVDTHSGECEDQVKQIEN